jgi:hydrocephalus-inducing protein
MLVYWLCSQRILILSHHPHPYRFQIKSAVNIDQALFSALPSRVHFSDYEAFSTYTIDIAIRNEDAVARRVKVEPPDSHYFSLGAPQRGMKATSKIAPGMDVVYTLTFKPDSTSDFNCDLICTTEREQFVIPVRAQGDRPKVVLPRVVDFKGYVNHAETRPFLVCNVGNQATTFSLRAQVGPFSLTPNHGTPLSPTAMRSTLRASHSIMFPQAPSKWVRPSRLPLTTRP